MTHRSPKLHRDPPTTPQPWLDPDPLEVPPEPIPWHGWEPEPVRPALASLLVRILLIVAVGAVVWLLVGGRL